MKMSISTAIEEHTDGEDDTSQESQAKYEASDMEDENAPENQNGENGGTSEVHEITSDDEEDDGNMSNDGDDSSNSSSDISGPDSPKQNNKDPGKDINEEDMENGDDESDIEEVGMEDPLNQNTTNKTKPIIVNDSKSLADLAGKQSNSSEKEPTVVIIDTNTIMSGKGPIPLEKVKPSTTTSSPAMDAQHLCQSIAARGTTITAVSVKSSNSLQQNSQQQNTQHHQQIQQSQPPILPSLTDDMYVVEAPSFMVPYVYEKPSLKPFREFVDELGKELEELKKKEEQEKAEKEKALKEKKEKERLERIARGEEEEEEEEESDKEVDEEETKKKAIKKEKRKQRTEEDDDSWDGESTDSEESNPDGVIKKKDSAEDALKELMSGNSVIKGKSDSYFDCTLGKFFINIGLNLVQEYVQSDLLKQQNRKLYKEKKSGRSTKATETAIASLSQNYEFSKKMNAPYVLEMKKCDICSFKTESSLVMKHHLEAPHMKSNIYKCNNCSFEIRSPHDILFHMEAMHNIRGRLERAPAYQQCANCTFEDNSKSKLARHLIACAKKFKPESNLAPPLDWEPPAKIPKLTKARNNASSYPPNLNRPANMNNIGRPLTIASGVVPGMMGNRPRGRPPITPLARGTPLPGAPLVRGGLMIMHNSMNNSNYPMLNNQGNNATPKISITPLPRVPQAQPVQPANKGTFVICEICDGYIKDLEQLRNHMQWIHKVKIHPKMIYNRPPLNCQKCQFRFFTDQGLERHLLGSHGLVTSSMQDAANKGKDAGRCPVCGRVYQWKLLNHVARDHNMTLKPAHLSYKCTVCTATFGMYKQFENHVYSAHSVVAKRVMDKNKNTTPPTKPDGELLKPIKINDEITIIPQPNKPLATTSKDK